MNSKTVEFFETYKKGIRNLPHALFKLIFPDTGLCGMCGGEGEAICAGCLGKMMRHKGRLCEKCGRSITKGALCDACQKHERPYDAGAVALYYDGLAREAMKSFKYENRLPYAEFFAGEIYKHILDKGWEPDIITAVPMHPLKLIGKAYNPPALIAKKLSAMTGIEYKGGLLKRTRYTKSMSLLRKIDRMEHSKKNFAPGRRGFENKNILLIDDVSTTGATLHVCAGILKKHGAGRVYVAAACGDSIEKQGG